MLHAANQLHYNLLFILEKANKKGNLAFSDININEDKREIVICGWYQKPTDTETVLNFRSWAPLNYKKSI